MRLLAIVLLLLGLGAGPVLGQDHRAVTQRGPALPPTFADDDARPVGPTLWTSTGTIPGGWLLSATVTPSGSFLAYVHHDRASGGLFRSTDGGRSWTRAQAGIGANDWASLDGPDGAVVCAAGRSVRCSSDDGVTFAAPTLDPAAFGLGVGVVRSLGADNTGALFALYEMFTSQNEVGGVVFRSQDGGQTWVRVLDVEVASGGGRDLAAGPSVVVAGESIRRSDDGGATWQTADPFLDAAYPRYTLEWTASGALLLGAYSGVYRSTDRGDSWELGTPFVPPFSIYALDARPDGTVAAFTTSGVFRSADDGRTFAPAGAGSGFWNFGGAIRDDGVTVGGGYDGVFRQPAPGAAFEAAEDGLDVFMVRRVVETAGRLFALGVDKTLVSADGGASWSRVPGLPANEVTDVAEAPDGSLLASSIFFPLTGSVSGIVRSTDGGQTWTRTLADLDVGSLATLADGSVLAAASGRAFRSLDSGQTWQPAGAVSSLLGLPAVSLTEIGATVWAATESGIFRSNDRGSSWALVRGGLPAAVGSNPLVYSQGVAGAGGALVAAAGNGRGVYRSSDGGTTWTPALDVSYAWDVEAVDGALWAATSRGAFESTDGGLTWTERSGGLPSRAVYSLARASDGRLLAGTGAGVFAAFGTVSAEPAPVPVAALRAWPSPVAVGRALSVDVGTSGPEPVQVDLLDALGRVVRSVSIAAGATGATFQTDGLAPGFYVVRATAPGSPAQRVALVR